MRQRGPGAQPAGSASPYLYRVSPQAAFFAFVRKTLTIVEMEVRKLRHDVTELLTRAVQPALWLLVFGEVLASTRAIPSGNLSYEAFIAPGILAQSVLFIAIFYGIAIIWERDLGLAHKLLVTPTPRSALVLGKGLAAGIRGLTQGVIIYLLAALLGVSMNWDPWALLGVIALIVLGASLFATFSLIIASIVKTRERFMGHRPAPGYALLLCQQRHIPNFHNAGLVTGYRPDESLELRGRRVAGADASGRSEYLWPGSGLRGLDHCGVWAANAGGTVVPKCRDITETRKNTRKPGCHE